MINFMEDDYFVPLFEILIHMNTTHQDNQGLIIDYIADSVYINISKYYPYKWIL